jgi:hypothetical protein
MLPLVGLGFALAALSDEEGALEGYPPAPAKKSPREIWHDMLHLWSKPILSKEDLERLQEENWTITWPGYLVDVYSRTISWPDPESSEYEEDTDHEVDDEHAISLEEAIELGGSHYWCETSSSRFGPGDWISSEGEENYHTGARTTHDLFIQRKDKKDLTPEECEYIIKKLGLK